MEPPKVNVEVINPFLLSTINAMKTMVFTDVKRVGMYVKKPEQTVMSGDISVLISIFGDLKGTAVLSFPRKLAIHFIGKMLMDESIDDLTDDVRDGIGEIGNLVGGGAKSSIASAFKSEAKVSIPTVITGKNHHLQHEKNVPCIGCVFESEGQRFVLEVAVRLEKKPGS